MNARAKVAVLVFPGTNSEEETVRICNDVGLDARSVHWSQAPTLLQYDAYVLPGGFAYEDRVRAGAIPAHDKMMDHVIDAAQRGKFVLGICNGAQIALEAGLVPGTGTLRKPTAAFTHNTPARHFVCRHVHIKLAIDPRKSAITTGLNAGEEIPAWAAHGQGRLAATPEHLQELLDGGHVAFRYSGEAPNGSALNCAGLINKEGNVLAIMPHPERDSWNFNHPDRRTGGSILQPSGGVRIFESFAQGLKQA